MQLFNKENIFVILVLIGLLWVCLPYFIWYKKYGKKHINSETNQLRCKYRRMVLMGLIFTLMSCQFLFDNIYEVNPIFPVLLWYLLPLIILIRYRALYEPYQTSMFVDELEDFCLYLRPFDEKIRRQGNFINAELKYDSVEKLFCSELNKEIATTYCIGDPKFSLPSTWGISNIYADDSEWQSVVSRMAQKSKLILMRVLDTDGCRWELLQCVNQYLDKTIFLLSGDSQIDFLKEILGKKYENLPNVSFLNNGCVALYIDKNTGKWNFVTIKSRKDVRLMLEHFAHNSSNLYEELCKKHERLSVLKNPFKKKKVSFRFYDIFNILIQPLWYIFYNKWPWFWKIVTGILLPICWLLIFNCSLFWKVFSAILFVFFSGYIAPKVSSAFDAWGSKQVCAMANKVLFHWIAVYCLFTIIFFYYSS